MEQYYDFLTKKEKFEIFEQIFLIIFVWIIIVFLLVISIFRNFYIDSNINAFIVIFSSVLISLMPSFYFTRYKKISISQNKDIIIFLRFGITKKFNIQDIISSSFINLPLLENRRLLNKSKTFNESYVVNNRVIIIRLKTIKTNCTILANEDFIKQIKKEIPQSKIIDKLDNMEYIIDKSIMIILYSFIFVAGISLLGFFLLMIVF